MFTGVVMALLRRKFSPFIALDLDEAPPDPLQMGSLVDRFRDDLSALEAFSDPIARIANRLRSLFRKRSRKPLILELPGKTLVFSSPAEFEFGLASRIEFPVRKAVRLVERDTGALEEMAIKLRAVEKHFAGVFARCLEHPDSIGSLLADLRSGLLSRDHDWRDIFAALNGRGSEDDDYKHIALVKYMQYLASRQAVVRSIYVEKVQGNLDVGPEHDAPGECDGDPAAWSAEAVAPTPGESGSGPFKETSLFDFPGPDGGPAGDPDGDPAGDHDDQDPPSLKAMPRGEAICVRFIDGRELDIRLSSHPYKLYPGKHFCLVDQCTGVTHLLRPGRNVIGRHSGNEVVVDPGYLAISRKHIIIEALSDNAVLLTDISSHGTFITPQYV
jgi:hypothetical protein